MIEKQDVTSGLPQAVDLRSKAEARLQMGSLRPSEVKGETDALALVHELQVHQIELEMQNEELQRAYAAAQEASALATANQALQAEIDARRRAEAMLEAAKNSAEQAEAAAEQANRTKDHFLAVLSHELRTPLTPVVMGLSMLQDRRDLDPVVRETLTMVRRNVELEARLIDDLLDVSRIARGRSY